MQNEIPAGTKVKVAVTQQGVTTYQDAEVLAHMDGLVHVDLNGDAVSVLPSQIVLPDAPLPAVVDPPVPVETSAGTAQIAADLIAQLMARVATLETLPSYVSELHARLDVLEKKIPAPVLPSGADLDAVAVNQAITEKTHSTDENTPAAAAGEAAAGS